MNDKLKKLYEDLSENAIQRTDGNKTGKKYDTAGYGYQHVVDRFNDIYDAEWGYDWDIIEVKQGTFSNKTPFFDITIKISIWIEKKENSRSLVGSHISKSYGDALKGAITNGFKKTAAMWGVGAKAYRGEIDDDNKPQGGEVANYDNYENNNYKINFEQIKKELQKINDIDILIKYHSELMQQCKSDKQKYKINEFFGDRKKEIEAVEKIVDGVQGEVFDDSQIPL